jgi:serine/threonine protein kinase
MVGFLDVSVEALDLIEAMLEKDPEKRPTATECLNFPWFPRTSDNLEIKH